MGHSPIIRPKVVESVQAYYAAESSLPGWPRVSRICSHQ